MNLTHRALKTGRMGLLMAALLVAGGVLALRQSASVPYLNSAAASQISPLSGTAAVPVRPDVRAAFGQLPLFFEPNQGQTDPQVKFVAHGSGYGLFLTSRQAVLTLQHKSQVEVIRMELDHANANAPVQGTQPLPGKSNYLIGADARKWHRNIPQYARVEYAGVYPGVDLVYYGRQGQLEYDFRIAPGADPRQIALRFDGSAKPQLQAGNLILRTASGDVTLAAPHIYQTIGNGSGNGNDQRAVAGRFIQLASNKIGFEIGDYDRSRTLVIDPVLGYSTYLGGSGNETYPTIAIDAAPLPNAYVTGSTMSMDFPIVANTTTPPFQSTLKGAANVFVAKINPTGSALIYATYIGGTGTDASSGIAVDSGFNAYIAGTTNSADFPVTSSTAFQKAPKTAGNHVFVAKLDSNGSILLYSTYLSGSGIDIAAGIAIDNKSDAFVTGTTTSTDFPTFGAGLTAACCPVSNPAPNQFFVAKVNTLGISSASLAYSTYFGGGNPSNAVATGGGIAVDSSGNIYITGGTNLLHIGDATTDFPILNAQQGCLNTLGTPASCPATGVDAQDAFVAKINPNAAPGAQLIYSTYLGGNLEDVGYGIAVDTANNAYVTGKTSSPAITGLSTSKPYQQTLATAPDAFVAKIGNPVTLNGVLNPVYPLNYFSYLGGNGTDIGYAIAVDTIQGVRVTGSTTSTDFPLIATGESTLVPPPIQSTLQGGIDAFVARIDTTTTTSSTGAGQYATYLGGSGDDRGTGIAVDSNGAAYVTGETASTNFPVVAPAIQPNRKGAIDAFVSKLVPVSSLTLTASVSPTTVGLGNQASFKYTITNPGPETAANVVFTGAVPTTNGTFTSVTTSPGSCTPPTATVITCTIGTLTAGSIATVTVILTPTAAGSLGNSGSVTANGTVGVSASSSVTVTDFSISVAPTSVTVPAGTAATYTVTVTPLPTYSSSISLSCSSGLPTATSCAFSTTPITVSGTTAVSSVLTVNTTVRPIVTVGLNPRRATYAMWLPLTGIAFLGLTMMGGKSRRRWLLGAMFAVALTGTVAFESACSSTKVTQTVTGTPAGTYTITVSGVSGADSKTTSVTLVVQ